MQQQRALRLDAVRQLGLDHPRMILRAIELLVEECEALEHVGALGLERGRGLEMRRGGFLVAQPIAAEEGEPAAQLRVARGRAAAETALEQGREARPVALPLE